MKSKLCLFWSPEHTLKQNRPNNYQHMLYYLKLPKMGKPQEITGVIIHVTSSLLIHNIMSWEQNSPYVKC